MFRFGLPSFKLLIVGILAASAFAYYKGEFPDKPVKGIKARPAAVVKTVRPPKPLSQKSATIRRPTNPVTQPRPTKTVSAPGPANAVPAKALPASRPAEKVSVPRPPAMLTGSVVKTPRPSENLPTPPKR